jgi:outer membrane murein-binding lipoprotein Lpp
MRVRQLCLALALASMLLVGCGGSGGAPSKEQYAAKLNSACRRLEAKVSSLTANSQPFLTKVREVLAAKERAFREFETIPKPSSDASPSEWLHWSEAANAAIKEVLKTKPHTAANSAANEREFTATEKARAIAKSYGLSSCTGV